MGKKLTHDEFMQKVMEKNEHVRNGNIEIRGRYVRSEGRIECYCRKHDVLWEPIAASLYKNIGCKACAKDSISAKNSKTHEEFVKDMKILHEGISVLTRYTGMDKDITVQLKCGHVWTTKAAHIYYNNFQCPYCTGNAILIGFNDLWTTAPSTATLLTNPNDGYSVSKGSGQKKNFTCPLCGKQQNKIVKNVVNRGLQCLHCGDGISYPNKFGRALLDQLPLQSYKPEYQPDWAKPYFYDNYFEYDNKKYIVEMDGNFHYNDKDGLGPSLLERQQIDRIKDELAKNHNITVIRIDCRISNCDYIKQNIVGSRLNDTFDLSIIDWQLCDMKAQKNLVKTACDLFMSGINSVTKISKIIKVSVNATIRYLKKGTEFGWCDYNPKKVKRGSKKGNPVIVTNVTTNQTYYFRNIITCVKEMEHTCGVKVCKSYITDSCRTGKTYKGLLFKYAENNTKLIKGGADQW